MFNIGDRIVYPMHGAGVIEDVEKIEILGEKREYFVMRMPIGNMKVMVPVDSIEEIGVRQIADENDMEKVVKILRGSKSAMSHNWNRRYRANMDRIKSGDIFEIAAVVRNLMILDNEKGLSTGERKMLNSAKQMLVSEMVLVCNKDVDETEKLIAESVEVFEDEDECIEEDVNISQEGNGSTI
ncbi:CarD family transcriptional regulator [Tissierella sp. Yu-01]|uniref:CarD family transcriptional regulator n=1 Tax=Tissierella sp. Yu-01 TaxID=3035694 RepID=UPI00240D3D69|nr:CarD family transcriptional regulator [Tissierella sp. Yu-01]WFA07685.1 CarD family transcriptional regulator [Tissierella sp. Yu-01]